MRAFLYTTLAVWLAVAVLLTGGCVTIRLGPSGDVTAPSASSATESPATDAPTEPPTEPPTEAPTEPPTEAPTGYAAASAWTTAEILAELAKAVNNVKTTPIAFTAKLEKDRNITLDTCSVENLRGMAEGLLKKLTDTRSVTYVFTESRVQVGGNLITATDAITPAGATFSVPEDAVSSARATYDGENLIIVLALHPDAATKESLKPPKLGSCLDYYNLGIQSVSPVAVADATFYYSNGSIAAGIDGQGRLVTITSSAEMTGMGSGSLGRLSAEITFSGTLSETWTFSWVNAS